MALLLVFRNTVTSVCKSAKVTVELVLDSVVSVRTGCVQSYLWSELKRHYFLIPTSVSSTLFSHLITLTGVFSKMLDAKDRREYHPCPVSELKGKPFALFAFE